MGRSPLVRPCWLIPFPECLWVQRQDLSALGAAPSPAGYLGLLWRMAQIS